MIKQLTEAVLQSEMEQHLSEKITPNLKNGYNTKTVQSAVGSVALYLADELEKKIISIHVAVRNVIFSK